MVDPMSGRADAARIRAVDVVLAGALTVIGLVGTAQAAANQPATTAPDLWAYVLVGVATVSVVAWRPRPAQVWAVTAMAVAVYMAAGYAFGPILFPAGFAMGALASRRSLRFTAGAAATNLAVVAVAMTVRFFQVGSFGGFGLLQTILWAGVVWLALPLAVGTALRVRREAAARVRTEQARRAVSEERLRMAQELHDVVGHRLAVIAMQAGVGLHVLDDDPAKAADALRSIRSTSKEALAGLREEIAAMRGSEPARRAPNEGLADLSTMVARVRSGGLPVRLRVEHPDELSAEADLAAYRIVQESLTNVLRHAGPDATAEVVVRSVPPGRLLVEVTDTGAGGTPPPGHAGSGIAGMRERAERLGGELEAGPRPGGGFAVRARLPLPEQAGTAEVRT